MNMKICDKIFLNNGSQTLQSMAQYDYAYLDPYRGQGNKKNWLIKMFQKKYIAYIQVWLFVKIYLYHLRM